MSRCFSYPPPGFAGKSASEEALILSIKLQEGEKAKSERKNDRRREKKEKKGKKHRKNDNKTPPGEEKQKLDHADHRHQRHSKLQTQTKESSYDQTERSNLTEEHGKPCCSSESTENSGKRKRVSVLPPTTNSIRGSGTVIRFRLSTQRRDDPPTPTSGDAPPCSTSGPDTRSVPSALSIPKIPKTNISTLKPEAPSCSAKEPKEAKLPKPLRKYKALFDGWAPPQLTPETPDDSQDWLFSGNKAAATAAAASSRPAKRPKCCKGEAPALQPRAQLLADVDIYALPFTVPF